MTDRPALPSEPIPSRARPYVAALGERHAVAFLIRFMGQVVSIPSRPAGKSKLAREIGAEQTVALRRELGAGRLRVPVVRRWLGRQLYAEGMERAEIAKQLRVTREWVGTYLAPKKTKGQI